MAASVTVGSKVLEGKLKAPLPDGRTRIVATRVEPALASQLEQYGVRFEGAIAASASMVPPNGRDAGVR